MAKKDFIQTIKKAGSGKILVIIALTLGLFLANYASAIVFYPPSASLGTGDITSNHILDGTIQGVDINTGDFFQFGQISIGTSSPYAVLSVWATTTDKAMFEVVNNASSTKFYIDSSGNVGIGTTNPTGGLHIVSSTDPILKIDNNGSNIEIQGIGDYPFNITTEHNLVFKIDSNNNDTSVYQFKNGTGTDLMTIQENGNIGIGTTSPKSILHINGGTGTLSTGLTFGDGDTGIYESASNVLDVAVNNTLISETSASGFFMTGGSNRPILVREASSATNPVFAFTGKLDTGMGSGGVGELSFIVGGTEMERLTADGTATSTIFNAPNIKVGIGTSSPYATLSVAGNVVMDSFDATSSATSTISGNLKLNGNLEFGNGSIMNSALSGYTIVSSGAVSGPTAQGTEVSATASCPAGSEVLGGGVDFNPGNVNVVQQIITESRPSGTTAWIVKVMCSATSCTAGTFTAYAVCMDVQ